MGNHHKKKKLELFFPYYINQSRLLDIYAILNGGYSEYQEISTSVSIQKSKSGKADGQASGGFKLVNLGGNITGSLEKTDGETNESHEKKVQTITSILSSVKSTLGQKGYLIEITKAKPGHFVCLPVNLQINSIKSMLSELTDVLKLVGQMQKLGAKIEIGTQNLKQYEEMLKSIQVMFAGEEIFFETDDFAVIGNILDENLYQSTRADLINSQMMCLAQVKRVYPEGTELMKNTIFTKIKKPGSKEGFINSMQAFTSGDVFEFEATAVPAVYGKPVYQLEIIALYQ